MAKLYFKYGPMKCGKTTDIIKTYYNYKEIHYEDTCCPKNPLNLVKDAFTKKVIDQNSLSVLGE